MKISADMLPTLSKLLEEALDLSPDQREEWLSDLPEAHREIAPTLRELLAKHDAVETRDFFATLPKFSMAGEYADGAPARFAPLDQVGPYRLLSELGRGGMGEVWLAERSDGTLTRRIALKLPHSHLSGAFNQRFVRERDILAGLSHPHIAQLYDAGVSAAGHSYLAMEWIDGVPITQYCRETRLPLAARLALFGQVLDAVNYAHARFIAHRDLKPANILVTRQGQVKLLDFGIAKLLSPDDTEAATELTQLGGRAATPGYAAPEQIAGQPITTAVDLYAAGVILFELLAGRRPFSATAPPSAFRDAPLVSQCVTDAESQFVGGLKSTQLRKELRGDLDAIVAKTLEHDPAHRYRSAEAISDDLRRSARDEPISARHLGRLTLARKFVRRHRIGVAMVTALVLTLLAGGIGIAIEDIRATAAAQRAEQEAARAKSEAQREKATKDFLVSIFSASDPRQSSDKPLGAVTANELLDASAGRIEKEFAADPDTQIELLSVVTEIYDAMQDYQRYLPLHARYVEAMKRRYGENDPRVIVGLLDEADHVLLTGDREAATGLLEQSDVLLKKAGLDHSKERALWWVGRADLLRGRSVTSPERVLALQNAIQLYAELAPTDEVYAAALSSLGGIRYRTGDDMEAIALYQRAIQVIQTRFGSGYGELAPLYDNLAQAQTSTGDFEAALHSMEKSVAVVLHTYGPTHDHYVFAIAIYARLLHRRGQRENAIAKLEPLMATVAPELDKYSNAFEAQAAAMVRESYGGCLLQEGRARQAIPYLQAAIRIYAALPMYSDAKQSFALHLDLAEAYLAAGRRQDAQRELASLMTGLSTAKKPDDPLMLRARELKGRAFQQQNDVRAADLQFREVLDASHGRSIAPVARAYADLALLALARKDGQDADAMSAKAVSIGASATSEPDIRLNPQLWNVRARVLLQGGNAKDARALAQRALDADRLYDHPSSPSIADDQAVLSAANAVTAP